MGAGKWIGGILGFMTMGPLGAFGRICLRLIAGWKQRTFWQYIRKKDRRKPETMTKASGIAFLFSMLVMASYIIRADGRIMHSEMEYVRQFLRMNFGEEAVIQGEQILLNLFEQRKQMERQNPMAFKKYHP